MIIEDEFEGFLDKVSKKLQDDNTNVEDLIYRIEAEDVSNMIVFKIIEISVDVEDDYISTYMEFNNIYFKEK